MTVDLKEKAITNGLIERSGDGAQRIDRETFTNKHIWMESRG
jgi:hypothetical protein